MHNETKRMTESAMLLSLAVVLDVVSKMFIPPMTFGGQVTLASMLPVVLIGYRYGIRWGMASGFCYGLIQMALGGGTVAAAFQPGFFGEGRMILNAFIMCALDYMLAYSLLGLAGVFRNVIVTPSLALMLGTVTAMTARYLAHVTSGYILFSSWAVWFFTQDGFPAWGAVLVETLSPEMLGLAYSVVYNGMYMVPETILTAIAAALIARVRHIVTKIR